MSPNATGQYDCLEIGEKMSTRNPFIDAAGQYIQSRDIHKRTKM